MLAKPSGGRRALDNWARDEGYSNFDTYIRTGGSLLAASQDIVRRIERLTTALRWIWDFPVAEAEPSTIDPEVLAAVRQGAAIGPEALARMEAEAAGEQPDPDNAQPQGDDHV